MAQAMLGGIAPRDVKYVCIKGGDLDGQWKPKEWLRDSMTSPTAAKFVPTGDIATRTIPVTVADPVLGTMQTMTQEVAFVYAEVLGDDRRDPRTRWTCPICPQEDLGEGRRRVVHYKWADFVTHAEWHLSEGDEDPRKFSHEGSIVEFAGDKGLDEIKQVGGAEVVGTATVRPGEGGAMIVDGGEPNAAPAAAPAADPRVAMAASMGISVEDLDARLAAPAPMGDAIPPNTDPVALVAQSMGIEYDEALGRLTAERPGSGSEGSGDEQPEEQPK